ncbi:hypothetical protein HWV62_45364 [Athelia sp. TMB]|nr:hypothetical protein HWV62_45364 [Athelia sp. TMB]
MITVAQEQCVTPESYHDWARLLQCIHCPNVSLISNRPTFYPETCETQLPLFVRRAAPLHFKRLELWTSLHTIGLSMTPGLRISRITYHTDVPGWDDRFLYVMEKHEETGAWVLQDASKPSESTASSKDLHLVPCVGATINPFEPTEGYCEGGEGIHSPWMVCEDGTICRREHQFRPRRPSDWVMWPNNTYGRRGQGMWVPEAN